MAAAPAFAYITHISVVNASISGHPPQHLVTLYFDPNNELDVPNSVMIRLAGLSTVPALNAQIVGPITVFGSQQCSFLVVSSMAPITAYSAETGAASTPRPRASRATSSASA